MPCLLISVRFHDGRYHGQPDWPPSPARLFQALVAGAARGDALNEQARHTLTWLESLEPPVIAVPAAWPGQFFRNFVPNNDLDAVGGDLARAGKIRAPKPIRPMLFDADTPLLYVWTFDDAPNARVQAGCVCSVAVHLYQLGRGVDMAWAHSEIVAQEAAEARISEHGGAVHRPSSSAGGTPLAIPVNGTLESLVQRHRQMQGRFQPLYETRPGRKGTSQTVVAGQVFMQPARPLIRHVAYNSPPTRLLFDLVGEIASWRLDHIVALTKRIRDAATERLQRQRPAMAEKIHNAIVGRRDADEADKAVRVRIMPLPSIGHRFADHGIRRILVEIPPNCPLRADDLAWAFSLPLVISEDGEIRSELVPTDDRGMLAQYGIDLPEPSYRWRTVTPVALSSAEARRRIDPARGIVDAKAGTERAKEERYAAFAAVQALRHAGVQARPLDVQVQREPFEAKGMRVEAFAPETRFAKEQLWHVSMVFAEPVHGPLVLGDGRYLGLGLMAPVRGDWRDLITFSLPADTRIAVAEREPLLQAVRRALMALSRDEKGNVPALFSGHEPDGAPANSGQHRHIFLACTDHDRDGWIEQLILVAPWACDRSLRPRWEERAAFNRIAASLKVVRAGRLGVIHLRPTATDQCLLGPGQVWKSHTEYRPARHPRRTQDVAASLRDDVEAECGRRGLPRPAVEVSELSIGPKDGIVARLYLRFAVAVTGPILLGRDSHRGGGLFEVAG